MMKLGIDPIQILAQLVNVGIVLLVLKKFLLRPVLKTLEQRQKNIQEGLALKDEMPGKILRLEEKAKALDRKAEEKADKLIREAMAEAKTSADKLILKAKNEAKLIREKAKREVELAIKAERARFKPLVIKKAAELANRALTQFLDQDTKIKLTEAQIKQIAI